MADHCLIQGTRKTCFGRLCRGRATGTEIQFEFTAKTLKHSKVTEFDLKIKLCSKIRLLLSVSETLGF